MVKIRIDNSDKCNGENSLFISFPYNQEIVNIMREQSIRYWHPDEKEWELPFKVLEKLSEQLSEFEIDIVDSKNILSNLKDNRRDNKLYT